MRITPFAVTLAAALALLAAGCQPPSVEIVHIVPADVAPGAIFALGGVDAEGPHAQITRQYLAEKLATLLAHALQNSLYDVLTAELNATASIETDEQSGQRQVRQWTGSGDDGRFEVVTLPTLRRTATVRCVFTLRGPGLAAGRPLRLATRGSYDSYADPTLKGELGLQRVDDPTTVPKMEQIVRELLDACLDQFEAMISPVESRSVVQLRDSWHAGASFGAVSDGRFEEAAEIIKTRLQRRDHDAALWFNYAVVSEKLGRLDEARRGYERADTLIDESDPILDERLRIVNALLLRQE
jgi:tetratricopeptide (TPR) repeat protein